MGTYGHEGGSWMSSDQRDAIKSQAESILNKEKSFAETMKTLHHEMWHHVKKNPHRDRVRESQQLLLSALETLEKAAEI